MQYRTVTLEGKDKPSSDTSILCGGGSQATAQDREPKPSLVESQLAELEKTESVESKEAYNLWGKKSARWELQRERCGEPQGVLSQWLRTHLCMFERKAPRAGSRVCGSCRSSQRLGIVCTPTSHRG